MSSTNGANGYAPGGHAGPNWRKGGKHPMMHIEDATKVNVELGSDVSIDKALAYGEECMKRAQSLKEFFRPDMALKEYMKAYTTIVEVIPQNKGFVSLIADRKGSKARYANLQRLVQSKGDEFEEIKKLIKEDNARTGVQPISQRPQSPASDITTSSAEGISQGSLADLAPASMSEPTRAPPPPPSSKQRPTVKSKPQALHGNAIVKPSTGDALATSKTSKDLEGRFANLRSAQGSRPNISLGTGFTGIPHGLPQVPGPIYSPSRATVSTQAGQLASSNTRSMFSRAPSAPPSQHVAKTAAEDDYFGSAPSSARNSTSTRRPRLSLPDGDTVTVQELLGFMQAGSKDVQVLLIDVRNRCEFDEGHIMSQATICIEPDILQRDNISASEVSDSLILAPASEARLFERRHEFDVVVFYDQYSERISYSPTETAERAVVGLYNALSHYDYQADLESRKPKLLQGGIEAWINAMGSTSLQTSSTATEKGSRVARAPVPRSFLARGPTKYTTKPIQDAAEAKRWEESLREEANSAYVKNTDDFLRRFPPVSPVQESMASPVSFTRTDEPRISFTDTVQPVPGVYPPPAKPAAALPRRSHSGLVDADDEDWNRGRMMMAMAAKGTLQTPRQAIGLNNPGNWCYANSSIQSLFGSSGFAKELLSGDWANDWKVPMKFDEKIRHPQLLSKILANFFHWMQNGSFDVMKAKTLMEYCHHIHSKDSDGNLKSASAIFGGHAQQDAQEFISFLITLLHDETNKLRDVRGEVKQPSGGTALSNGITYWADHCKFNASLVDKYWRGLEVALRVCTKCSHEARTYEPFDLLSLPIDDGTASATKKASSTNMTQLLENYCKSEKLDGYKCDKCKTPNTTQKRVKLVRLPNLLCFAFKRFKTFGTSPIKDSTIIQFPINGLNLTQYTVQGEGGGGAVVIPDEHFEAPFKYDCYAVIVHSGDLRSGHYRAFVKEDDSSDPRAWHHFNDSQVESIKVSDDDQDIIARNNLYHHQGANTYMVFYQRRKS